MLFTSKTQSVLEFDKIREMLSSLCSTEGAKARALSLTPSDDYETVVSRQSRTYDARRLVNAKGYPSFSAPESALPSAERAYKGSVLSPRELLEIASLLRSSRAILDYINTDKLFSKSFFIFPKTTPHPPEKKIFFIFFLRKHTGSIVYFLMAILPGVLVYPQ